MEENIDLIMIGRTFEDFDVRKSKINPTSVSKNRTLLWGLDLFFLVNLFLFLCCVSLTAAESNGCDFIGSGLEQDSEGVQPVYLKCAAGRVHWQYPRAALRILLRHPLPDREFQGCIRADPDNSPFQGARVYLEGHRSLLPLLSKGDSRAEGALRCFTSYKGQVALYVEAEPEVVSLHKHVVAFEYDLMPLPRGETYNPSEECRPCTDKELVQQYCVADFVARGSILSVDDHPRQEFTSVHFRASKVYQQSLTVFTTERVPVHTNKFNGEEIFTQIESNLLSDDGVHFGGDSILMENSAPDIQIYTGRLQVPLHCGAQAGPGEFVVMGNVRLGHPILRCAPRLQDWLAIPRKVKAEAPCILEV